MDELNDLRSRGGTSAALVESGCAGCGADVRIGLSSRTTEGPAGSRGAITYADADIAVWDCPACGFTNADAFGE